MKAPKVLDQETLDKQGFFSLRKSWQTGDERVLYSIMKCTKNANLGMAAHSF